MNLFDTAIEMKKKLENEGEEVEVDGKNTLELFGVNYVLLLSENENVIKWKIPAPSLNDMAERGYIYDLISEKEDYVLQDINTRRVVLQPKYDCSSETDGDGTDLAACVSFVQFIIRRNVLYMFVVYRSMNFSRNFLFDNQTWLLYGDMAKKSMKEVLGIELEDVVIRMSIVSLHKYIPEEVVVPKVCRNSKCNSSIDGVAYCGVSEGCVDRIPVNEFGVGLKFVDREYPIIL